MAEELKQKIPISFEDAKRSIMRFLHVGQMNFLRETVAEYDIPKEVFSDSDVLFEVKNSKQYFSAESDYLKHSEPVDETIKFLDTWFPEASK